MRHQPGKIPVEPSEKGTLLAQVVLVDGLEQHRTQCRRHDEREDHRQHHRRDDGDRKLPVYGAGRAAEKRHRQKYGGQRQRDADKRSGDFVHRFDRGVVGREPLLADLCLAPFVGTSISVANAPTAGSKLAAWVERAFARPSVAETVKEARAFDRGDVNVADLVARGLFKREYRDHRLEWMIKSGGLEVVLRGLEEGNIRFAPDFG